MSLRRYLSKRNFAFTGEPRGKLFKRKTGKLEFVVQKHAARRLHYDLRLEVDGVLKSWAVPKGPSTDPSVKRLAIMVEDHPFAYRKFEGTIEKGYGAGEVLIWDKGTYIPAQEMREGLKKGAITFTLYGKKLKGEYTLVKLKGKENEWLLIKKKDAAASQSDITKKEKSVVSGKTLKKKPKNLKPMLTTLIKAPFDSKDWIFEIKLDGFRSIAEVDKTAANLYSRNNLSFNKKFPLIAEHLKKLNLDAILDGEIVALDEKGISHFQKLQNPKDEEIYYYVFDILYLDGKDLRSLPLLERKKILKRVLKKDTRIRYLDHIEDKGKAFFNLCEKKGLEGIIGKKKESLYHDGVRSKEWVKIKASNEQEVVVCGFTEPKGGRKNFGALIVGVYKDRILHYAGHVGGGFSERSLKDVKAKLKPLITSKCPFEEAPKTNMKVTWVKPKFLAQVKFREWTQEGNMRQPIFLGLRHDKAARSVVKEEAPLYDFVTHSEKVFWKKEGITKGDLVKYYDSIASYLLPHLKDRPESLRRFPNGIEGEGFFQKNLTHYPEWVSTVKIEHSDKMVNYLVIQDKESLAYAVNLGCIEIHPWFSRHQSIDNPDFLVWDLDPEDVPFDAVIKTAQTLHTLLEKIKVPSYCKTTGSRGLHIAVPLGAKYTYEQAKQFALAIAYLVKEELPTIVSLERKPKNRQKRVYIDCFQNNFAQTLASPYSVRAKPGAPVSTPLSWDEVKKGLDPHDFTMQNTLKRLKRKGDLFKPVLGKGIDLLTALKRLSQLYS